jgi:hypothetical protein
MPPNEISSPALTILVLQRVYGAQERMISERARRALNLFSGDARYHITGPQSPSSICFRPASVNVPKVRPNLKTGFSWSDRTLSGCFVSRST